MFQIQVKMKSHKIRVGPKSSDGCPYKGNLEIHRQTFTEGGMPGENRGRNWRDVATSQVTPGLPAITRS